ncbi:MAG: dTDP-4-amino-4,6-dideoxyglucose formyltransferase [Flavobacteriales bacterium]|jgi:methionyl-tRNA formyltransferase|nr:dTDP-4-amino-4,6-dideoxyglucose formyltransferase [Flavobacteriales bacterium]
MAKILIVSDNPQLATAFVTLTSTDTYRDDYFEFRCSSNSETVMSKAVGKATNPVIIKLEHIEICQNFDLVISLHCKQLFPVKMVQNVRCINVHPGLNPFNRGWFPQVFSIINGLPLGATIHEIDELLDHGNIIAQEQVELLAWDTSKTVYHRVLDAEIRLLQQHLRSIIDNTYVSQPASQEGNVNLKKDYNALCEIDLSENLTFSDAIDRLRALTHAPYQNAFFIDPKTGKKVFVSMTLTVDSSSD